MAQVGKPASGFSNRGPRATWGRTDVKRAIKARRDRREGLFPITCFLRIRAWDMMLALYSAELAQVGLLTVSNLCDASNVPPTTALQSDHYARERKLHCPPKRSLRRQTHLGCLLSEGLQWDARLLFYKRVDEANVTLGRNEADDVARLPYVLRT